MMAEGSRGVHWALRVGTRPARFVLVGVSGIGVNMAVLWVAKEIVGLPTAWGGALAWLASTFTNFLLNDAYTWRDRAIGGWAARGGRLLRYYGTTLVGLVISVGLLVLLADHLGVYLLLANLVAIGVGGTVNYLLHNAWTWRSRRA